MTTELEKIERKTVQYWFQDGLFEMAFGVFLLLLALFFLFRASVPLNPGWRLFLDVGLLPFLIYFGVRAVGKTVRSLKKKITYPRTGYVSYRKPERKKRAKSGFVMGATAGILSTAAATLFSSKSAAFAWMPAWIGLIFALGFWHLAVRSKLTRMAALAVIVTAAGIGLSFSGWGEMQRLAVFFGTSAVSLAFSGWITFRRYLRSFRLPGETSQ